MGRGGRVEQEGGNTPLQAGVECLPGLPSIRALEHTLISNREQAAWGVWVERQGFNCVCGLAYDHLAPLPAAVRGFEQPVRPACNRIQAGRSERVDQQGCNISIAGQTVVGRDPGFTTVRAFKEVTVFTVTLHATVHCTTRHLEYSILGCGSRRVDHQGVDPPRSRAGVDRLPAFPAVRAFDHTLKGTGVEDVWGGRVDPQTGNTIL